MLQDQIALAKWGMHQVNSGSFAGQSDARTQRVNLYLVLGGSADQ